MRLGIFLKDRLYIQGESEIIYSIVSASFYKIHLRRYVELVTDNMILFKLDITYLVMKNIVSVFQEKSIQMGFVLYVDPFIIEYVEKREMYLEARSKLGIEIKNQKKKLLPQFLEFCSIISEKMERTLRPQQLWDAFFMTMMKKSCNFSVPGSGKTTSVLGVYSFLMAKELVKRIVVICPKNAFGPWIDEFEVCFGEKLDLNLFNIHDSSYHSSVARRNAIKYESGSANLLLFNYECIKTYEREISALIDSKTLLVFDEVHKVKRIDGEYAHSAIQIARNATYSIAMTGTPIPNSYQDIYNLLHILYFEEYDEFFGFQPFGLKTPNKNEAEHINKKLQPFFCRTTKADLNVPKPNSDSILPIPASTDETIIFRILLKKYKKNKLLLMLRILQLESDPELLLSSINLADYQYLLDDECLADDIDYADYSQELVDCIHRCKISTKTQQCINIVRGLVFQKKPVIIWCIFVKTIKNLARLLESKGISVKCVYGEIPLEERQEILQSYKKGTFDVLISNPNTLAESVSLHTICHDAIYFEYSFNLVHLLQSKDRIHRLGLADNQYTQFYFLQTMYPYESSYYSIGEQIYLRLNYKEQIMLKAIDADILEVMPTTQEELELIFKQVMNND